MGNFKFDDEIFVEPHDYINSVRDKYINLLKSRNIDISKYTIKIHENFEVVVRLENHDQLVFRDFLKYTNGCYIRYIGNNSSVCGQVCGIEGYTPTAGHSYIVKILQSTEFMEKFLNIGSYKYTHTTVWQYCVRLLTDEEMLKFATTLEKRLD